MRTNADNYNADAAVMTIPQLFFWKTDKLKIQFINFSLFWSYWVQSTYISNSKEVHTVLIWSLVGPEWVVRERSGSTGSTTLTLLISINNWNKLCWSCLSWTTPHNGLKFFKPSKVGGEGGRISICLALASIIAMPIWILSLPWLSVVIQDNETNQVCTVDLQWLQQWTGLCLGAISAQPRQDWMVPAGI